jgi:mannan endo-1,4-beta-mannosidase
VNALIVVDAHQYGQRIEAVIEHGDEVLAADPQHNVVFSQHLYGYWKDAGSSEANAWGDGAPYDIAQAFSKLRDTGLAIIIGEFAWDPTDEVTYTTKPAMKLMKDYGFGWVAWCFNLSATNVYDMVKADRYDSDADLTDFGQLIVNDPEVGLKATSAPATIFD